MTKVLIGYPTSGFSRHTDFYDYINSLEVPCEQLRINPHGLSPAKARNIIFEQALAHNCTHVFLVDDDMALAPDSLVRLLNHDKDIVSGLYLQGSVPHQPLAFSKFDEKGKGYFLQLTPDVEGLVKVVATGFGCCLIKTDVLQRMQRPWVRLGELDPEQWCDDIGFFFRLSKELPDVEVFVDTDVRPGHIKRMIVNAHKMASGWMTGYSANGVMNIYHAQPNPQALVDAGIAAANEIEGWMSVEELTWLAQTAKNKELIVEFGSHCGRSTRALADNSPEHARIYAIDPWSGEYKNEAGKQWDVLGGSRWEDFQRNLFNHINSGKVVPVRKLSTEFELKGTKADFVFIDGDHRYESVLQDIEKAISMTGDGGIISGHDYCHESWPGVYKAVNEIFGHMKIMKINVVGTIWWVQW